jgi:hypothetical protein
MNDMGLWCEKDKYGWGREEPMCPTGMEKIEGKCYNACDQSKGFVSAGSFMGVLNYSFCVKKQCPAGYTRCGYLCMKGISASQCDPGMVKTLSMMETIKIKGYVNSREYKKGSKINFSSVPTLTGGYKLDEFCS